MEYTVYVIQSKLDGRLYKGLTTDIELRLKQHNSGKNFSTKPYAPWILVYTKAFNNLTDARKWEKYFKSGSGREFLQSYINLSI